MSHPIYYLKRKSDDTVIARLEITGEDFAHVNADCSICYSWSTENEPLEYSYFASVYCKHDGCTHWWFRGEDYVKDKNLDGYYHLCGSWCFVEHIRVMCFIWKAVEHIMRELEPPCDYHVGPTDYFDTDDVKNLVETMLDGHYIERRDRYKTEVD